MGVMAECHRGWALGKGGRADSRRRRAAASQSRSPARAASARRPSSSVEPQPGSPTAACARVPRTGRCRHSSSLRLRLGRPRNRWLLAALVPRTVAARPEARAAGDVLASSKDHHLPDPRRVSLASGRSAVPAGAGAAVTPRPWAWCAGPHGGTPVGRPGSGPPGLLQGPAFRAEACSRLWPASTRSPPRARKHQSGSGPQRTGPAWAPQESQCCSDPQAPTVRLGPARNQGAPRRNPSVSSPCRPWDVPS